MIRGEEESPQLPNNARLRRKMEKRTRSVVCVQFCVYPRVTFSLPSVHTKIDFITAWHRGLCTAARCGGAYAVTFNVATLVTYSKTYFIFIFIGYRAVYWRQNIEGKTGTVWKKKVYCFMNF
jgi:hypothetical protein